jgi:hypothetical protein
LSNDEILTRRRDRLSEVKTVRHLLPFVRASAIEDISLYWLPVSEFPIGFRQRAWILEFFDQLHRELETEKQTVETFLQLKYARTELNERFTNTLMEYRPMTGILLAPGGQLPHNLTALEAKELSENPGKDGTIDIDYLAPDYTAWFAGQQHSEQRRDFFGAGGMMLLWIDEGGEPPPPSFDLPNVLRTHPAMKGVDFQAQMRRGLRLQHPFLTRSREIFAAHLPDGIVKKNSLFVLPLFQSLDFIDATPEQRAAWFEIFSAYCVESPRDKGILLALRDGQFDEKLIALVEATSDKMQDYPQ